MPDDPTGRLRRLGALVARHDGIALTLAYIILAAIGMMHLAAFYAEFRINVLEFAEVSDLLLAPFRDPFVVLVSLLPIPVFALMNGLQQMAARGWHRLRKSASDPVRRARDERLNRILWPIAFVLWLVAFNLRYVDLATDRIKAGGGKQVVATYANGGALAIAPDSTVTLLPGTARFAFFYRASRRELVIVPLDNLGSIVAVGAVPRR